MTFKQPGAFTFAKVDVPGNVFEGNRISVIIFNVGKDTAQPVIIRAVFLDILWLIGNVRQKQPPHPLQANDHIQLIELRLFLIKGNDLKQMLTKCTMPGLTLINADIGKPWILKHRIYIPAVYSALKKAVNQSGIKDDRNVGAVLLVFHGTGMKSIGIVKYNIPFLQMVSQIIYIITHGALLYISDFDFRVPVSHKSTGFIFGKPLIAYKKGEMFASVLL